MLYFWRLLFAMWPWLPIAESKIKGNNCVKCFWLNLTINFFPQQYFRTKMSIWLHLYASLSCCRAGIKNGLRCTGPGVLTRAPAVGGRRILLRKCLPRERSSEWGRGRCPLVSPEHPRWGRVLSGTRRSLCFHSLQFFLQLLIKPPWIHWCFNALFTSKNFNQCSVASIS